MNARIDGDSIVYPDYVDLSVAVATPKRFVMPVLRNGEPMGYLDIEKESRNSERRRAMANGQLKTWRVVLSPCLF